MTEIVTTGRITWLGQVIACRECGARDRWAFSTERTAGASGEIAWAQCANTHRGEHPLVYPELVHRVAGWARDVEQYGKSYQQNLRDWAPCWLSWDGPEPEYHSWTEPGPVDWEAQWPDLVEAGKVPERIAEWSSSTSNTDMSVVWMGYWGTTDPDKRYIELAP